MLSENEFQALVSLPGKFHVDGESDAPSFYPHVLLAEDNECTLRVVQQLLIHCGYRGDLCDVTAGNVFLHALRSVKWQGVAAGAS